MLSTSNIVVQQYSYTPSWIKTERLLYCDHFAQDYAGAGRASWFAAIRRLLHR